MLRSIPFLPATLTFGPLAHSGVSRCLHAFRLTEGRDGAIPATADTSPAQAKCAAIVSAARAHGTVNGHEALYIQVKGLFLRSVGLGKRLASSAIHLVQYVTFVREKVPTFCEKVTLAHPFLGGEIMTLSLSPLPPHSLNVELTGSPFHWHSRLATMICIVPHTMGSTLNCNRNMPDRGIKVFGANTWTLRTLAAVASELFLPPNPNSMNALT